MAANPRQAAHAIDCAHARDAGPDGALARAGDTDLGDLVLEELAVIRGRCRTRAGQPIGGLSLRVAQDCDWGAAGTTTDAQGRFRLLGLWQRDPVLELPHSTSWARSAYWVLEGEVHLDLDAESNDIVLVIGGEVAGRVLPAEGQAAAEYDLSLVSQNVRQGSPVVERSIHAQVDGTFNFAGLPLGSYTLQVRGNGGLLFEAQGITVLASSEARDPRLQEIDLTDSLRTLDLDVRGADGKPVIGLSGSVHANGRVIGGSGTDAGSHAEEGKLSLTFPTHAQGLIMISSTSHSPAFLETDTRVHEVTLPPPLVLMLYANQRPALVQGKSEVRLSLKRPAQDARMGDYLISVSVAKQLAGAGTAQVLFPGPGSYRLYYSFKNDWGDGYSITGDLLVPGDFSIDVRASDAGSCLHIQLPASFFVR